jgi:hypothetical protein
MALTVKKMSPAKSIMTGGQSGYREQHGIIQFTGTDLTGSLPVQLRQVEAWELHPVLPYTLSGQAISRPTIDATTVYSATLPAVAGDISAVRVKSSAGAAANNTNYWTAGVVNASNSNAVIVDSTDAANSTKSTGGAAWVAATNKTLTLTSTTSDLAVDASDVLTLTITKAASAPALGTLTVEVDVTDAEAVVTTTAYVLNIEVSATAAYSFTVPADVAGVLTAAYLISGTTAAANDTNYWTFALARGSTAFLAATDANTTKATGGSAVTATVSRTLPLAVDAPIYVKAGDTLTFTATKSASAPALRSLVLWYQVQAVDVVTMGHTPVEGIITVPAATGLLTLNRGSHAPSSNLQVAVTLKGI